MSYTKRRLENLIDKAQEEFCDFLVENPFYRAMDGWDGCAWSSVAKSFSFCFILKNTGDVCEWGGDVLEMFRDHLLDAASE